MEQNITRIITDKQNSVGVKTNAKGDLQYEIKMYFNDEDITATLDSIEKMKDGIISRFGKKKEDAVINK